MNKNALRIPLIGMGFLFFVTGCDKETPEKITIDPESTFEKTDYNLGLLSMAKAVNSAMTENGDFRTFIKNEAVKQFDGDYDILLRNVIDAPIPNANGRSEMTVRTLLTSHWHDAPSNVRTEDAIAQLIEENPCLQISVPLHAETWDATTYTPQIAIMPEEYRDSTTLYVPGYNQQNQLIAIDAVNEPDMPVIVISQNERTSCDGSFTDPVSYAPTSLVGSQTESGIRLSWNIDGAATTNDVVGYYIYKKGTQDATFLYVATVTGLSNRIFDDNNVVANASYSYYVSSYNYSMESSGSNIISVTAPNIPKSVLKFDAIQFALNDIELRWENDNSQFIQSTILSKRLVGGSYQQIGTFNANQHEYIDNGFTPGQELIYKINHVTDLGVSNPKYDFVRTPYRDISKYSPVYIKQVKFSDWDLEGWLAGKPEFYVTVTNLNHISGTPYTVQDQINLEFNDRSKTSQKFRGKKVLDWKPGFWYDMLSFYALEYDKPSGQLDVTAEVKLNVKNENLGLDSNLGAKYEITFEDKGEKCGNSYLDYYQNPETWLVFPKYGVQILVSESDD